MPVETRVIIYEAFGSILNISWIKLNIGASIKVFEQGAPMKSNFDFLEYFFHLNGTIRFPTTHIYTILMSKKFP